jgi:hypothetical protein
MTRIFLLIVLVFSLQSQATECAIDAINFPNINCSFSPPFEAQQLKFGNLDSVTNSGNSIRLGAVHFNLTEDVEIFDAHDPTCDYDGHDLEDEDEGQEIAFKVSETDSREITQLWLLDCTVEIAR